MCSIHLIVRNQNTFGRLARPQALGGVTRRPGLHRRDADTEGRRDRRLLRRPIHVRDPREGAERGGGRAHVAHDHTDQGGPGEVQGVEDHRPHRLRRGQHRRESGRRAR